MICCPHEFCMVKLIVSVHPFNELTAKSWLMHYIYVNLVRCSLLTWKSNTNGLFLLKKKQLYSKGLNQTCSQWSFIICSQSISISRVLTIWYIQTFSVVCTHWIHLVCSELFLVVKGKTVPENAKRKEKRASHYYSVN